MLRTAAFICSGLFLSSLSPAHAQDAVLDQMYGSGVHAYFAGDYFGAHTHLTIAIDSGSKDPRAYYFRALAYERLGRSKDAQVDLTTGADLEVAQNAGSTVVSRALTRIQGRDRKMIERRRREAQMANLQKSNQMRRQRFGAGAREEVLPPANRGSDLLPDPKAAAPEPAKEPDLFAEPAPGDAAPAEPAPAPAEPAPAEPAAAEPAPADPSGDPFGDDEDQPADAAEEDQPESSDEEEDASNDPFS